MSVCKVFILLINLVCAKLLHCELKSTSATLLWVQ